MIAGVFRQAVVLDPSRFDAIGRDRVGKDVVDALAGKLGGEGALGFGKISVHALIRVQVAGVQ